MGEGQGGISDEAASFLAWLRIQEHEAAHPDQPYATILDLRQAHPKAPIDELARQLGDRMGSPVSPDVFRKILSQARRKFMDLATGPGPAQA